MTETTNPVPPWKRVRSREAVDDLQTFIEDWQRTLRSPETRRKYAAYLALFLSWLERYSGVTGLHVLHDVTLVDMEDYFYDYLGSEHWDEHAGECNAECQQLKTEPYGTGARLAKRTGISSFYSYAVKHQERTGVRSNPTSGLDLGSLQRRAHFTLTPDELVSLVRCARADSYRSAVIVGMLFGAGLRREELHNVDVGNFHDTTNGRRLKFRRKGGQERYETIDIPHAIRDDLDRYLDYTGNRNAGPLVVNSRGRRWNEENGLLEYVALDPSTIFREVRRLGRLAQLPQELAPHDGKRTATTYSLRDKARPETRRVQLHFGHKSEAVTLSYFHPERLPPRGHLHNVIGLDWETQGFSTIAAS